MYRVQKHTRGSRLCSAESSPLNSPVSDGYGQSSPGAYQDVGLRDSVYGLLDGLLAIHPEGHSTVSGTDEKQRIRQRVENFLAALPLGIGRKSAHIEAAVATRLYDVEMANTKLIHKLRQWSVVSRELQSVVQEQQQQLSQLQTPNTSSALSQQAEPAKKLNMLQEQLATTEAAADVARSFITANVAYQQPPVLSPDATLSPIADFHATLLSSPAHYNCESSQRVHHQNSSPSAGGSSSFRTPQTPSDIASNPAVIHAETTAMQSPRGIDPAALFASQQAEMKCLQSQASDIRTQLQIRHQDAIQQELDIVLAERNNLTNETEFQQAQVAGLQTQLSNADVLAAQLTTTDRYKLQLLHEDLEVARVQLSEQKHLVSQGKQATQRLRKALLDAELEVQSMSMEHEAARQKAIDAQELADHWKVAHAKLQGDIAQERSRAAAVTAALEAEQQETEKLRQQVQGVMQQLDISQDQVEKKQQQLREVEVRWGTAEREVSELQEVCQELQSAVEQLHVRLSAAELEHQAAMHAQASRCQDLQDQHGILDAKAAELEEKLQTCAAEVAAKEVRAADLETCMAKCKSHALQQLVELEQLHDRVQQLHQQLQDEQEASKQLVEVHVQNVEMITRGHCEQLNLLEADSVTMSGQLHDANSQLEKLQLELEEAHRELASKKTTADSLEGSTHELQSELASCKHNVHILQHDIVLGHAREAQLSKQVEDLESRCQAKSHQLQGLACKVSELEDGLDRARAAIAVERQTSRSLQRQNLDLERELGRLVSEKAAAEAQIASALMELQESGAAWRHKEEELGIALAACEVHVVAATDRADRANARADDAEARAQALEESLRGLQLESSSASQLKPEFDAKLVELRQLQTELLDLRQQCDAYQDIVERARADKEQLEASENSIRLQADSLAAEVQELQNHAKHLHGQHLDVVADLEERLQAANLQACSQQAAAKELLQQQHEDHEEKLKLVVTEANALSAAQAATTHQHYKEMEQALQQNLQKAVSQLEQTQCQLQEMQAAAQVARSADAAAVAAMKQNVEQQIEQLHSELQQQREHLTMEMEQQVLQLREEYDRHVAEMQSTAEQAKPAQDAAEKRLEELTASLQVVEQAASEERQHCNNLQQKLQVAEEGLQEAKAAAEQLASMAEEAADQRDQAQQEASALLKERQHLEEQCWLHGSQVEAQLEEAHAALDRLAVENAIIQQRAEVAEVAVADGERIVEQQMAAHQLVVEELNNRLEEARNDRMAETLRQAVDRVSQLEQQVAKSKQNLKALEDSKIEMHDQVMGMTNQLQEERKKVAAAWTLQASSNAATAYLRDHIKLLEAQMLQQRADLVAARQVIVDRDADLAAAFQNHAAEYSRLSADVAAARQGKAQLLLEAQGPSANSDMDFTQLANELAAAKREAALLALELADTKKLVIDSESVDRIQLIHALAALRRDNTQITLEQHEEKTQAPGLRTSSQLRDTMPGIHQSLRHAHAQQQGHDHQQVASKLENACGALSRLRLLGAQTSTTVAEVKGAKQQVLQLTRELAESQQEAEEFENAATSAVEQARQMESQLQDMQAALERAVDRANIAEQRATEVEQLRINAPCHSTHEDVLHAEVTTVQRALQRADDQVERLEQCTSQASQTAHGSGAAAAAINDMASAWGPQAFQHMQDVLYSRAREQRRTQQRVQQLQGQVGSGAHEGLPPNILLSRSLSVGAATARKVVSSDSDEGNEQHDGSTASPGRSYVVRAGSHGVPSASPGRLLQSSLRQVHRMEVSSPGTSDSCTPCAKGSANADRCNIRHGKLVRSCSGNTGQAAMRFCCYETSQSDLDSDSD